MLQAIRQLLKLLKKLISILNKRLYIFHCLKLNLLKSSDKGPEYKTKLQDYNIIIAGDFNKEKPLDNVNNLVIVKLVNGEGYRYNFFNDVHVDARIENKGVLILDIKEP